MSPDRKSCFEQAGRIVVKLGSGILTADNDLNTRVISSISRQTCRLLEKGQEIILVSSGAMASGVKKVNLPGRPLEIPRRQAAAAVGQAGLIMAYEKAFNRYGRQVAQILLIADDLTNRRRYLNARNTLNTLLDWQVVPVVNENDTVSTEEIQFSDNDNLAAMIALMLDADMLINLTDIDGFYSKDPRVHRDAQLLPVVESIDANIEQLADKIPGSLSRGGMLGKIKAAKKITRAGIPMVIAGGDIPNVLLKLFDGKPLGTFFVPGQHKLASRKRWIGLTLKPKGRIQVDKGAAQAIYKRGKSLLASGIVRVHGDFDIGTPVEIQTSTQETLGTGLVNYCAEDIRKIMGLKSSQIVRRLGQKPYDEVIHRDNLVIGV